MYIKGALDAGFNVHMKNTLDNKISFLSTNNFLVKVVEAVRGQSRVKVDATSVYAMVG